MRGGGEGVYCVQKHTNTHMRTAHCGAAARVRAPSSFVSRYERYESDFSEPISTFLFVYGGRNNVPVSSSTIVCADHDARG